MSHRRSGWAPASRRIDIETEVNWRESEKVLKAAFPLDVHAERSTSEIQFGHVHRPTHDNTGWDAARFEICAHRWLRVAEPGYGVTLLNDSTYGHDVTRTPHPSGLGTTVRLTLLRAPRSPDPETDLGFYTGSGTRWRRAAGSPTRFGKGSRSICRCGRRWRRYCRRWSTPGIRRSRWSR